MAQSAHPAPQTRRRLIIALLVVTILAALLMVAAAVLIWKNGADDGVVLKDNVVIYEEGSSPFTILASDADSVTVSSLDGIVEGDVLAAGITSATPNGLLCWMGKPEVVGEGWRIPIRQASLVDAIEKCDVKVRVAVDEAGNYRINQLKDRSGNPLIEQAFADDGWFSFEGELGCPLFEKKAGSLSAEAWQYLEIAVSVNWDQLTFRLTDTISLEISIDGVELDSTELFNRVLRPFEFNIGPLPVVVAPSISAEASLSGNAHGLGCSVETGWGSEVSTSSSEKGELQLAGKIEKCVGFEYTTGGGPRAINEDRSLFPRPIFNLADESFGADVEGEVSVSFKALLYGVSGVELSTGLAVQISAELTALPTVPSPDGAVELPGISKKFAGTLSQKVTLPISGSLVMEDLNVLGWDLVAGFDLELFDSGDAITLLDETQSFDIPSAVDGEGESGSLEKDSASSSHRNVGSGRVVCTTKFPGDAPQLSFVHPADWKCSSLIGSETSPWGPQSAVIDVSSPEEAGGIPLAVQLEYLDWYGGDMWICVDRERTARLVKVADAALAPPGESAGSYVVAEAIYPKDASDPDNLTSEMVLVPVSYLQQSPLSTIQDTNCVAFDFLGRAVCFSADIEGLSNEQRQELASILGSLQVAE
ncbi:hypothetical protein VIN30_04120 [Adlercreutzia sp. R7]|uniref:DUF1080 domain-containing protein n=1 Tax=Adlercreutzia wanghongyangiae TaxID=3111451 RepID=A0ABU6IGW6_9ACTN|nr:hypothetical protein [Adlercreutzia sp. R7]